MMQSAGIVVNDVTVTWRNGHTALRDASFTVPSGSIAALVGVNGSGKSTLFKAIMGFVRLTSGKISVLGIPTRQALQKNLVAYVPQSEEVDWSFPVLVEDVVMMGRYRRCRVGDAARAEGLPELLGSASEFFLFAFSFHLSTNGDRYSADCSSPCLEPGAIRRPPGADILQ